MFSLSIYTIKINKHDSEGNIVDIPFGSAPHVNDFFAWLHAKFEDGQGKTIELSGKRMLTLAKVSAEESSRNLTGTIKTGLYGYEGELVDSVTTKPTHKKGTTEAELIPFYFLFHLPKESGTGFLVIQRFRQAGVKGILVDLINEWLFNETKAFRFSCLKLTPKSAIDKYIEESKVKTLKLIRKGVSSDIADVLREKQIIDIESVAGMEIIIKAKRNKSLSAFKALFNGDKVDTNFVQIPDFDHNTIKIETEINGKKRMFNVEKLDSFSNRIDITDDVAMEPNGHPNFDSINSLGLNLLSDLLVEIKGGKE